jgi:hypothetical protein
MQGARRRVKESRYLLSLVVYDAALATRASQDFVIPTGSYTMGFSGISDHKLHENRLRI